MELAALGPIRNKLYSDKCKTGNATVTGGTLTNIGFGLGNTDILITKWFIMLLYVEKTMLH